MASFPWPGETMSFPWEGTVTICEITGRFIHVDHLSDNQASDTYGKYLEGNVFSPINFESFDTFADKKVVWEAGSWRSHLWTMLAVRLSDSHTPMFRLNNEIILKDVDLHSVSWHHHKRILAFVSGLHQVTVCDYDDHDNDNNKSSWVLSNESQKKVTALEWRPNGGKTLSVACKAGICIWAASYLGNVPSHLPEVALNIFPESSKTQWTLVDILQSSKHISALSWSPNGRYLASASFEGHSVTIWDFSQGSSTLIRKGFGGISLIKWSTSGDYFFAAKFNGTFCFWNTNTWTSQSWTSDFEFVTGATWDPDGHMLLLSFSESPTLSSIQFSSELPSHDAELTPVELSGIKPLIDSLFIKKIAWDASGLRLAVSYKECDDPHSRLVAVFEVTRTPLVSTSLIGFIRGPGDKSTPVAFSFHDKFRQGSLLSVCWSTGFCCTYPLIFWL